VSLKNNLKSPSRWAFEWQWDNNKTERTRSGPTVRLGAGSRSNIDDYFHLDDKTKGGLCLCLMDSITVCTMNHRWQCITQSVLLPADSMARSNAGHIKFTSNELELTVSSEHRRTPTNSCASYHKRARRRHQPGSLQLCLSVSLHSRILPICEFKSVGYCHGGRISFDDLELKLTASTNSSLVQ